MSKPRMPPNFFLFSKKKNWCVCIRNWPPMALLLSMTRQSTPAARSSSRTARPAGPAPIMATVVLYTFLGVSAVAARTSAKLPVPARWTSFTPSTFVMQMRRIWPSTTISQAPHLPIPHSIVRLRSFRL